MGQHIHDIVASLLDTDAPAGIRDWAERHLAECDLCRAEFGDLIALHRTMDDRAPTPDHLVEHLVASIRKRVTPRPKPRFLPRQIAAGILLGLALGLAAPALYSAGRHLLPNPPKDGRYLLLLAGRDTGAPEAGRRTQDAEPFWNWIEQLHASDRLVFSGSLREHGARPVSERSTPPMPDAYRTAFERMDGFFVIRAVSIDEAVSQARVSPYLRGGGTILVMPLY